jgi:hypothetical protein
MVAVPFFLITITYKTLLEILIMIFLLIGFICDSYFTYNYLTDTT